MQSSDAVDVRALIARGGVETHFQPITSIRRQSVIGIEALSRGVGEDGAIIPPIRLFGAAAEQGLTFELDRLCRERAIDSFLPLHAAHPELILFLNLDVSTVEADVAGGPGLIELAQARGVNPPNLAVEILETAFGDEDRLRAAVERYRAHGFLVVLDDVGAGHANLDRIAFVKPDIIKADRSLVQDVDGDYHKLEVLKALVQLSERIGGWIISEGVETLEEAVATLQLGGDMLQGFYLARPHKIEAGGEIQLDQSRVVDVANAFKRRTLNRIIAERSRAEEREQCVRQFAGRLQGEPEARFDDALAELVAEDARVASACVLNMSGIQASGTVWHPEHVLRQKRIIYRPPARGADHSMKEYYYLLLETPVEIFETQPYVPLPTGDLCITASTQFTDAEGTPFILCLHLNTERA
ncbi:EAL domain-containing protein [Longimicrobium terrae]|uniref:EAL domain-containing protein (Putative c-di-GMP-specific phosphodiesterase class I) n=1 Tax=Longimicrobium terrae TaxID=1639882 RepID=A0A841GJW3_9BACT|nr:EAL domain-containing protein [Longimicrobium terrae]MBB4634243.1 EAL domain-containing protein (putative c-di-GMP-specific phosphodiesterase class I) [Longimicrobium terrae]MBB6068867.1 EAL domain-containing protein (putative c-di-GMP-specific phosphodiesterase class I) [Longimicrobium terrae]NNC28047.1 EAL domain-containing protein [Longimicrobium terrae]